MSALVLTVLSGGQMILSTERQLSANEVGALKRRFEEWSATPNGVAVVADCRIQHAASVEIDLPEPSE